MWMIFLDISNIICLMFKSLEDKQMGEHNFIIIIYYFIIFLFLKIMWMIFLDIEKKMTNQIP